MAQKKRPQKPAKHDQFGDRVPNLAAFLQNTPFNISPTPNLPLATILMAQGNWESAYSVLLDLHAARPKNVEVLEALVETTAEMGDPAEYEWALMQLSALRPNDADITLELAEAHMGNQRIVKGVNLYRRFVERWPSHAEAPRVQTLLAKGMPELQKMIEASGMHGPDMWEWAAQHEDIQIYLDQGSFKQARSLAKKLLKKHPDFMPALNNLSLIYWLEDSPDQAIAAAQQVLKHDEQNVHALANLTRFLFLHGDHLAAESCAAQLKGLTNVGEEGWHKQVEALAYLGDDVGVLAVFERAKKGRKLDDLHPLLHHLAAVAHARLGDAAAAKRLWTRTKKLAPLDIIENNLANISLPPSQRYAPWPFSIADWFSPTRLIAMTEDLNRAASQNDPAKLDAATERLFTRNRDFIALMPSLLDRGDPAACDMAFGLADSVRSPELLDALQGFAFGQRGTDELRYQAATILKTEGRLPDSNVTLWINGAWQEVILLAFDVHTEPYVELPPTIEPMVRQAIDIIHTDPARAEQLLKKACELAPDMPQVAYNLSVAYLFQGRKEDAVALVGEIAENFPDYFFAQVALARQHIDAGEYEQANARLQPLVSRGRFHFNEASALCEAQVGLLVAQQEYAQAQQWLAMWRSFDQDSSAIKSWESQVTLLENVALLAKGRKRGR